MTTVGADRAEVTELLTGSLTKLTSKGAGAGVLPVVVVAVIVGSVVTSVRVFSGGGDVLVVLGRFCVKVEPGNASTGADSLLVVLLRLVSVSLSEVDSKVGAGMSLLGVINVPVVGTFESGLGVFNATGTV